MKKICCGSIIIFLICICTIFCNQKSEKNETVKKKFFTGDLLEDYDFMWEILEEEYHFFPVLEAQGFDIKNIREMTREQIESMEPDIGDYYQILNSLFLKLNYYAHLNLISRSYYENMQQYYVEHGDEGIAHYWIEALNNKQVQTLYRELLPENISEDTDFVWPQVEKSYDAGRKMVIFRIRSFQNTSWEQDKNLVLEYLESLEGAPVEHIVFDITGNRGGYEVYWLNNLVAPFGGNYEWDSWIYLQDTEFLRNYYPEAYKPEPLSALPDNHLVPDKISELGFTHFVKYTDQYEWVPQLDKELLNAKRWVLIDNMVYSAADKFAYFCKSTGWADLVGTKTLGGGGAGTPEVIITLPNTGLLIRFFAGAKENFSGEILEGIAPDYVSERYEAPESTLYQLIE